MKKFGKYLTYFSKFEWSLWLISSILIIASFMFFDRQNYMTLIASLVGITSLILCAKGNPIGEALMIIFSIIYGCISYNLAYYGEMITYIGMTLPMSVIALISWLKNPFNEDKSEVTVNKIYKKEFIFAVFLTIVVTVIFYFILSYFNTANIIVSTFSVATSFFAVYLTFRRSEFFPLAYAVNDFVLIVLWTMASVNINYKYISVVACFVTFLFNDIYGFVSWRRMKKRQNLILAKQKATVN